MSRAAIVLLLAALGAGCAWAPPAPEPAAPEVCCPPPEPVRKPVPALPEPEPELEVKPEYELEVEPRLIPILADLGITAEILIAKRLRQVLEATELVVVQVDPDGRRHELTPAAAAAYHDMRAAAAADGIQLDIVSAYRSVARQVGIVRRKLDHGETLDEILSVSAPPGFSEHHSGNVVDLRTPGSRPLTVDFADTPAYRWLDINAHRFGFVLSFPEDNPEGYMFEPWHWRFDGIPSF